MDRPFRDLFLSVGLRRLYVWKWVVGDYIFLDVA